MPTITEQARLVSRIVDLTAAPWQAGPRRSGHEQAKAPAGCCADCAGLDAWVTEMGGFVSPRWLALCQEARETAGPDAMWRYLDMARAIDEGNVIDMAFGQEQAGAQRAGGAELVRELMRRLDAAAGARQRRSAEIRLATDQAAVEALLSRSAEIKLTMDELRADPRVTRAMDAGLDGPHLSSGEVTHGMLAAMGLAGPQPGRHEKPLSPAGNLAREIGLKQ